MTVGEIKRWLIENTGIDDDMEVLTSTIIGESKVEDIIATDDGRVVFITDIIAYDAEDDDDDDDDEFGDDFDDDEFEEDEEGELG